MPKPKQDANRNGACVAVGGCPCPAYAFGSHQDGFDTCTCTHTRWAHAVTSGKVDA